MVKYVSYEFYNGLQPKFEQLYNAKVFLKLGGAGGYEIQGAYRDHDTWGHFTEEVIIQESLESCIFFYN